MNKKNQPENKEQKKISFILKDFVTNLPSKEISIGEIKDTLGDRAFGIMMLIFALPNLIPIPIPGISAALGIPLILLSYQLMKGKQAPWFPSWIANRTFKQHDLDRIFSYCLPHMERMERVLKPRWSFLIEPPIERFLAGICLVMAAMVALPVPLGNWFPALCISLFALAILERDGICAIFGLIAAIISTILVSTVILAFIEATLFLVERMFN